MAPLRLLVAGVAVIAAVAAAALAVTELSGHTAPALAKQRPVARLARRAGLAVVPAEGGPVRLLTRGGFLAAGRPTWSPDGKRIAYAAQRCGSCRPGLELVRPDGGGRQTILRTAGVYRPAFSPDGRWLAFTEIDVEGEPELKAIRPDGTGEHDLVELEADHVSWTPDGRRIAFEVERSEVHRLFSATATGANVHQLVPARYSDDQPVYSPEGRTIAFVRAQSNYTWRLYAVDADGGRPHPLGPRIGSVRDPAWSPDGRHLAFASDAGSRYGFRSLWIVDADGTHPRRLTAVGSDDSEPAWSPDGRSIVFVRRSLAHR